MSLAVVVDTGTLLEVVGGALAAGVGLTAAFSLLIYGAARAGESRRAERTTAAAAYLAMAGIALAACALAVAFGVKIMLEK